MIQDSCRSRWKNAGGWVNGIDGKTGKAVSGGGELLTLIHLRLF